MSWIARRYCRSNLKLSLSRGMRRKARAPRSGTAGAIARLGMRSRMRLPSEKPVGTSSLAVKTASPASRRTEGRSSSMAVGAVANGFDAQYYLFHNPDVAAAGVDPLLHYNTVGWQEGRDPNAWFDTSGYLAHNPDVAAAGINP